MKRNLKRLRFKIYLYFSHRDLSANGKEFCMYKKIYLEITNICNLDCSFCHKTKREKKFLSKEDFSFLAEKIRPYTDYLYLHLMGEPLIHPELTDILGIAHTLGFHTTVATNGVRIKEAEAALLSASLYKITFSLHSYEANSSIQKSLTEYINDIISFCKKAERNGSICVLRLWNEGGENELNSEIISLLKKEFTFRENRKGYTLSDKIYLEEAEKFIWPDENAPTQDVHFCMGLRDHIGVLSDGSVVPCCLDADGSIVLGNLFNEDLDSIIKSDRARNIYDGFSEGKAREELCRRCQYATRFKS